MGDLLLAKMKKKQANDAKKVILGGKVARSNLFHVFVVSENRGREEENGGVECRNRCVESGWRCA